MTTRSCSSISRRSRSTSSLTRKELLPVTSSPTFTRHVAAIAALSALALVAVAPGVILGTGPTATPRSSKDPSEIGPGHNPAPPPVSSLAAKLSTSPSPWVSRRPVPGIVQSRQAPFFSSQYSVQNSWFDVVGAGYVVVYAGNDGEIFDQGLVVVEILDADQHRLGALEIYRTPTRVGPLRIESAEGRVLTMRSSSGATFTFNATLRTFGAL